MKRRFIPLQSKIFEHKFWLKERCFSEFEAWLWLIYNAHYPDYKAVKCKVAYGRGQLVTSYGELCTSWGWSGKSRVHRFISLLTSQSMISTKTENRSTIITILNYENYNPLIGSMGKGQLSLFETKENTGQVNEELLIKTGNAAETQTIQTSNNQDIKVGLENKSFKSKKDLNTQKTKKKNTIASKTGQKNKQSIENQHDKNLDLNQSLRNDSKAPIVDDYGTMQRVSYQHGGGHEMIKQPLEIIGLNDVDYQQYMSKRDVLKTIRTKTVDKVNKMKNGTIGGTIEHYNNETNNSHAERLILLKVEHPNYADYQHDTKSELLEVNSELKPILLPSWNDKVATEERFAERPIYNNKEYRIEENIDNLNTILTDSAESVLRTISASSPKNQKAKSKGSNNPTFSTISDKQFKAELRSIWENWFLAQKQIPYYWSAVDANQLVNLGNRICYALFSKNQNPEAVNQENFKKAYQLILEEAAKDEFFLHKSCKLATLVTMFGDLLSRIVARENGKVKHPKRKDSAYYQDIATKNMSELELYMKESGYGV